MINTITLLGNLGKAPELRATNNGKQYAYFSVATSENYQKDGRWEKTTEWHNIKVWGQSADRAVSQLKKGSKVYIEGSLKSYAPNPDEPNNRRWEVIAKVWRSLDPKPEHSGDWNQPPAAQNNQWTNPGELMPPQWGN
jgi:single-strand DNA-binding protein